MKYTHSKPMETNLNRKKTTCYILQYNLNRHLDILDVQITKSQHDQAMEQRELCHPIIPQSKCFSQVVFPQLFYIPSFLDHMTFPIMAMG